MPSTHFLKLAHQVGRRLLISAGGTPAIVLAGTLGATLAAGALAALEHSKKLLGWGQGNG